MVHLKWKESTLNIHGFHFSPLTIRVVRHVHERKVVKR